MSLGATHRIIAVEMHQRRVWSKLHSLGGRQEQVVEVLVREDPAIPIRNVSRARVCTPAFLMSKVAHSSDRVVALEQPPQEKRCCARQCGCFQSGVSLAFVMRHHKQPCKNRSEWRLPPGKPPESLSDYYQFACDFGTPLMLALHDVQRSQPIYL